jgi:predicted dehydrogenase
VEKPFARDARETSRLLTIAETHGALVCPVHQFLFQRGVQETVRALPALAPIHLVRVTICSAGAEGMDDSARDRVAWEILPHPLSIIVRSIPNARIDWRGQSPAPGELRVTGLAGGITAAIVISMGGRPPRNELEIIGAAGTVEADLFHGFFTLEPPGVSKMRKIARPFSRGSRLILTAGANLVRRIATRELAYPGLGRLVRAFHAAAMQGGAPPISPAETLAVASHIDAVRTAVTDRWPR